MTFSERLKQLRKDTNSTQLDVAKAANISDRAYRNLESGTSVPNLDTLLSISYYFNVSLDYLVGLTDDPVRKPSKF